MAAIEVTGLRQVALAAPDAEASTAFYRDVLGLRIVASFGALVFVDVGGGTRFLLEPGAPVSYVYFAVTGLDAAFAAARDAGAPIESEPNLVHRDDDGTFGPRGEEEWMAFVRDPGGNLIGLVERRRSTSS